MLLPQSGFTELILHLENSHSFMGTKRIQPAVCETPAPPHTHSKGKLASVSPTRRAPGQLSCFVPERAIAKESHVSYPGKSAYFPMPMNREPKSPIHLGNQQHKGDRSR